MAEETQQPKPVEVTEMPKITRRQWGQIMRRQWTQVRSTVVKCGHKFDPNNQPRYNCEDCWEAYFVNTKLGDLDPDYRVLEEQHGKRFVKMLRKHLEKRLPAINAQENI